MTGRAHDGGATAPYDYGVRPPGHRLPDATRVGAVRLQISDVARSLEFYQQVLGLRAVSSGDGRAELAPHGAGDALVNLIERTGARPARGRGHLGLFHFAILLPDRASLGRFVLHLSRLGVRFGASDHLVSEALYLSDPDGLGIEVYADRPRGTWQATHRELAMSTLPLDLEDLVRAGGESPWTGMPEGTTMGHVHLHVGDIDGASAFYHDALGLDRMVWSYPGALFLSAGGYHHHLGVNTWAGSSAAAPDADDAQLLEWELILPQSGDVGAAGASLERAGHAAVEEEHGFVTRDPWGTALRLRADRR